MTTVSNVPTTSTPGFSIDPGSGIDGDTILAYCSTQLNDLGADVRTKLAAQKNVRDQKALVTQLATMFSEAGQIKGDAGAEVKKAILLKFSEIQNLLPPGPMKDTFMGIFNSFRATACFSDQATTGFDPATYATKGVNDDMALGNGDSNTVDSQELEKFAKDIQGISDDLGKDSEINMIEIQQAVSARQQAIQMSTSLMSKTSQGTETIASNIGK